MPTLEKKIVAGQEQVVAMPGTLLELTNGSDYPDMEIQFIGESPVSEETPEADKKDLVGKSGRSVYVHVSQKEGTYLYTIHYTGSAERKCKRTSPRLLFVARCRGCE